MRKIIIVADDLTGANANGSLLAAKGFSAATCLNREHWNTDAYREFDAISINTDSRLLPQAEAMERVYGALSLLLSNGMPAVVAKRIDSTLRGNVGSEIEAALKAFDECPHAKEQAVAVVVPAFPTSSRLAVGGYLVVNGLPLEKSPIAKDPVRPITTSQFSKIIGEQTSLVVGYVPLDTIMKGEGPTAEAIERLRQDGVRIIACDAVTNGEIATIAAALKSVSYPVLAVDPGPFTAAMADARVPVKSRHELEDNALVVVGSTTELIRRQMDELRLARKCTIIKMDCRKLVNSAAREGEIASAVQRIMAAAGQSEVYGVCTVERPEDVYPLEKMARENDVTIQEASDRINRGLAEVADLLLQQKALRLGGVYSSGGEVTVAVARQLEASGFSVRDEVLPLAVYGRLIGGKYPNIPMVTKGGFVGDNGSIALCINYLFAKISTQTRTPEGEN